MLVDLWLLLRVTFDPPWNVLNGISSLVLSTAYWAGVVALLTFIVGKVS